MTVAVGFDYIIEFCTNAMVALKNALLIANEQMGFAAPLIRKNLPLMIFTKIIIETFVKAFCSYIFEMKMKNLLIDSIHLLSVDDTFKSIELKPKVAKQHSVTKEQNDL